MNLAPRKSHLYKDEPLFIDPNIWQNCTNGDIVQRKGDEPMARVLIADEPIGASFLQSLLADEHELLIVDTLKIAVETLWQRDFDLIIIGVHFDDSRMYELMTECKSIPTCIGKPIICFCTRETVLTRTMHESIDVSSKALGAWMYIDQHDYNVKKNPDAELKRVIERCLVGEARKVTQGQRQDIQKRRAQLLRLREALEEKEWTMDLEDRVADIREKLSHVLLELSRAQVDNIDQYEKLSQSKDLDDRVSVDVTLAENKMARAERQQSLQESKQLAKEQAIVPREEAKAKKGRRKLQNEAVKTD